MNKFIKILDYLVLGCLNCVLITLTFSKAAVESLIILALLFWLSRKAFIKILKINNETFFPRTSINMPILIYVIICVLSTLNSTNLNISLIALFAKILENIAVFFLAADTFNTKKRVNFAITTLFVSLSALVIDCGFQYFTGLDLFRHFAMNADNRLKASFSNSNDLAGWLIITAPIFIFLAFFNDWAKPIIKKILIILSLLVMTCLILTFSRAALIGLFVACFIFSLKLNKKTRFLLVLMLITILILTFTPLKNMISFNFLKGRGAVSVHSRIDLWKKAAKMTADYPILGAGPGTYVSLIGRYNNDVVPNTSYPHNSFLHIATEIGLLGLGAFFWILFRLFYAIFKKLKHNIENPQKYILLGLGAGLMAFLIQSFFDTNLFALQLIITFWLLAGLTIGFTGIKEK